MDVSAVVKKVTGGAQGARGTLSTLMGMMGGQDHAGFNNLLSSLTSSGLADQAKSWISTNSNQLISGQQVASWLGSDKLKQLAQATGLNPTTSPIIWLSSSRPLSTSSPPTARCLIRRVLRSRRAGWRPVAPRFRPPGQIAEDSGSPSTISCSSPIPLSVVQADSPDCHLHRRLSRRAAWVRLSHARFRRERGTRPCQGSGFSVTAGPSFARHTEKVERAEGTVLRFSWIVLIGGVDGDRAGRRTSSGCGGPWTPASVAR